MTKQQEEAFELLKVWFFIKTNDIHWPEAETALEDKISELLEINQTEDWIVYPLHTVCKIVQ